MKKQIINELEELVDAGIISPETSDRIRLYFKEQETNSRFSIIISVLASIFVGLGIILILNHNWDIFSRSIKTLIGYFPLVVSIALMLYTIIKKQNNRIWLESVGTLLFFSIGTTIALISQIYNLYPNYIGFVQSWLLLSIPILFLLKSRAVIILSLALANFYIFLNGVFLFGTEKPYEYIILILMYSVLIYRKSNDSDSITNEVLFTWLLAFFIPSNVLRFLDGVSVYYVLGSINLATLYILISKLNVVKISESSKNALILLGNIGLHTSLIFFTNPDFFKTFFNSNELNVYTYGLTGSFILLAINSIGTIYILIRTKTFELNLFAFLVYSIAFFFFRESTQVFITIINSLIIFIGVEFIRKGTELNSLRRINYGLLLNCIVIIRLFFDIDLSITMRGILFLIIGILFYISNRILIQRMALKDER